MNRESHASPLKVFTLGRKAIKASMKDTNQNNDQIRNSGNL